MRVLFLFLLLLAELAYPVDNWQKSLKRVNFLLNGTMPGEKSLAGVKNRHSYMQEVRSLLSQQSYYDAILRYHEKTFGTGLLESYMEELIKDDIDDKVNKFAEITCDISGRDGLLYCSWAKTETTCSEADLEPVSVFWYPGIYAWVCPSLRRSCGADLSRCFVDYRDREVAANSELGKTQSFDSRVAVIKSLSKQAAGLATAVVIAELPYTKILEPGLTAMDGAIAHFYRQKHHFKLDSLQLPPELLQLAESIPLTDTRFHLVYTGFSARQAGVLSTFAWLRRYEKNRSRANQLYERLLCRQFTADLPRVFPQDPGNLRTADGCKGCHATLDPLADFFRAWGEGGALYEEQHGQVVASFAGNEGTSLAELAEFIRSDKAFGTCAVTGVWEWLVGRGFSKSEADLRAKLTDYFAKTNFNFTELVFAIATHPGFTNGERGDALVAEPLFEPPLGEIFGGGELAPCVEEVSFDRDISPRIGTCIRCHNGETRLQPLLTEDNWRLAGQRAVNFMSSGEMPPEQSGPPRLGPIFELKELVRCWLEQ